MRIIQTPSFIRFAASFETGRGYEPDGKEGEAAVFNVEGRENVGLPDKKGRWKSKRLPSKKIYQLGVDVPVVERSEGPIS